MALNDRRLNSTLYQDISGISKSLQNFDISPSPYTAVLPMTTRGLGFGVFTTQRIVSQLSNRITINPHVLYRVTLAQHYFAMHQTELKRSSRFKRPTVPRKDFNFEPFQNFTNCMALSKKTFAPIVAQLSAFGDVNFTDASYAAIHPVSTIAYVVPYQEVDGEPPAQRLRVEPRVHHYQCDPYLLRFSDLRDQLLPLVEGPQAAPLDIRNYFIARNPIPGAIFQNGFLTNIDAIIPPHYDANGLQADIRQLNMWLDILSGKFSHIISEINYTGKGQLGAVVSARAEHSCIMGQELQVRAEYAAFRKIGGIHFAIGSLAFLGEIPDDQPFVRIALETWGIRALSFAVESDDLDWMSMFDNLLTRH